MIDINEPGCVQLRRSQCVRGLAYCRVLSGAVLTEGYTFSENDHFPVYAPITHHAIELRPVAPDTIVKFEPLEVPDILNGRELFQTLPPDGEKIIAGLYRTQKEHGVEMPEQFSNVLNRITNRSRLCVIGGKSSGKSTANRILLNSLLMKHTHVYFLEMDPGQPEFNVSGWLSLVKVTKPRIGPNFCFLRSSTHTTVHQRFLGNFDLSKCARQYLDEIVALIEAIPRGEDVPVIFNAMGWLRELGLRVLIDAINAAKIDLIYYLRTNTSNDLPEDLNPAELMAPNHPMNGRPIYRGRNRAENPVIIQDQSRAEVARANRKQSFRRDFSPRTLRDIAYSCYGHPWLGERPLSIPFSDIAITFIDSSPSPNRPFQVLNNCLVSLSSFNADLERLPADRDGLKVVERTTTRSAGWGWLRHVDMRAKVLFIHTSLPLDELTKLPVNLLQVGHLPVPKCFAVESNGEEERPVPYVQKQTEQNVLSNSYRDTKPKKRGRTE